jgi:hypothetical protein
MPRVLRRLLDPQNLDRQFMNSNTSRLLCNAVLALAAAPALCTDLETGILSCAARTDDGARLRCYDQVATDLRHSHTQVVPAPRVADPRQHAPDSVEEFGQTRAQAQRMEGVSPTSQRKQLAGRIASVTRKSPGYLIFHLDNSQIWEQTESGPDLHIAAGEQITIDRGLLGSYWLSTHRSHQAIKVRRIQ